MGTQLRPPLIASTKMFYRSLDTVLGAAIVPLLMLVILALARHLDFAFAHRAGSVGFFSFIAIGFAAFMAAHSIRTGS